MNVVSRKSRFGTGAAVVGAIRAYHDNGGLNIKKNGNGSIVQRCTKKERRTTWQHETALAFAAELLERAIRGPLGGFLGAGEGALVGPVPTAKP